jgi:acyl carrier protein
VFSLRSLHVPQQGKLEGAPDRFHDLSSSQEGDPMPDRDTIRKTLVELLEADTGEKFPNLDDAANFREGLGLDSVDLVSIVSQVERHYRIRLSHEELEKLVTVGDALDLVQAKLAAAKESSAA